MAKETSRGNGSPRFDADSVKKCDAYVVWLDVLGTKTTLRVSHAQAANFVMKLHIVTLEEKKSDDVQLFPMNDGVFIRATKWEDVSGYLGAVLNRLAKIFIGAAQPLHRFMVRGAVAFGPCSHGAQLTGGNGELRKNHEYIKGVILGMPLAQAVEAERAAPPFGLVLHESARAFAPPGAKPLPFIWWRWWGISNPLPTDLQRKLKEHFTWAKENPVTSQYPPDALAKHQALAEEYFRAGEPPVP